MSLAAWLKLDKQFAPGDELFRSERTFSVWAYTVSHSQLLLRARAAQGRPRLDVLFKPVAAMNIRADCKGLVVRCATVSERAQVLSDLGRVGSGSRVLMLASGESRDYVVASAVGWKEDQGDDRDPRSLALFSPGADPGRILPG